MVKKVVMMATVPLSLLLLVSSRLTPVDNLPLSFVSSEATLFNVTLPPYLPHPNITLLPQNALECSDFDDDELYPIDPYNGFDSWDNCEIQDALSWCETCQSSKVCNKYCGNAEGMCAHDPSGGFQYVNPCLWEIVTSLPQVCSTQGSFHGWPPLRSHNVGPPAFYDGTDRHSSKLCASHSICQTCVVDPGSQDEHPGSGLNKYCYAVSYYYSSYFFTARYFFADVLDGFQNSFWCQPEVLQAIEDGSFQNAFAPLTVLPDIIPLIPASSD